MTDINQRHQQQRHTSGNIIMDRNAKTHFGFLLEHHIRFFLVFEQLQHVLQLDNSEHIHVGEKFLSVRKSLSSLLGIVVNHIEQPTQIALQTLRMSACMFVGVKSQRYYRRACVSWYLSAS